MDPLADPYASRPFWQRRSLWVLLLLFVAVGYFGSYYQHGINFRDEGGTITLLAKRVHDGEVPFKDVVLGYNVGWFFPIAGLFKITGVSFVALRVYFFALSTLAAVLGFLTVERAARHAGLKGGAPLIGFVVGMTLIAVPGMTFKNYNPLAAVANAWCLLGFILATNSRAIWGRALIGGLVLGVTWLVRIDLGTFFTVLWLGVIGARLLESKLESRGIVALGSLGLLVLGVLIPHGPVVLDAHRRGYLENFWNGYESQWEKLGKDLKRVAGVSDTPTPALPAKPTAPAGQPTQVAEPSPAVKLNADTLARTTWSSVSSAKGEKRDEVLGLFLLTYLPLVSIVPLVLWAAFAWGRAVKRREDPRAPLAALTLVGAALTMFPQYFFWRPDAPHLSEFGPGFWCGVVGATLLLGGWGRSWLAPSRWLLIFLVLHAGVWFWRMAPDRWCGTIAARANRKAWLEGANGVRVYEQQKTVDWLNEVVANIVERSSPTDYLVAYPYHPAFNVIANRPTYEKNVYVDNATASARWHQDAIARMERFKPKIVIISGWSINGTPASRFKNWAAPVYAHIRSRYEYYGTFGDKRDGKVAEEDSYELFVRRREVTVTTKP
jgi:hypothetical protein